MDKIKIDDAKNLLQIACGELEALRAVMQALGDAKDIQVGQEMTAVTMRALGPIICDIREAIDTIEAALLER